MFNGWSNGLKKSLLTKFCIPIDWPTNGLKKKTVPINGLINKLSIGNSWYSGWLNGLKKI